MTGAVVGRGRREMWKTCQIALTNIFSKRALDIRTAQCVRTFLSTPIPEVQEMDPRIKTYEDLYKFSLENPDVFWKTLSRRLNWKEKFTKTLEGDFSSGVKWFPGGKLNVSVNCVDRHASTHPERIALIHEKDEPNQCEFITYAQLLDMVKEYAYMLRTVGKVKKGDRVAIYLSCTPTAVAMALACARLGAIHSIVFAGFSSDALASRINDASAKVLITSDIAVRGGKVIKLKNTVDAALKSCSTVETVLVDLKGQNKSKVHMSHPRDHFIQDLAADAKTNAKGSDVVEYVDSNDPLFILYTSGSTGTPKGLVHSTAGYLLYAMVTHNTVFDFNASDTFGCVADVGWITGHSYIMYGPLANGGTTLLFESIPTYPDPGRYWELVERLKLTHFYAAPTALRVLMKHGTKWVFQHDRSSLRVLGSVGEPINKDAWTWYHDVVGEKRCTLVDTWWQTETGGICLSPRPSGPKDPIVPAMAMRPFFGIKPKIIGAENESETESIEGPLCIEKPWPGMASTIWGAPARFKETYFSQYPPYYFTGDGAIRNEKGYWKITGRMDDVINVTGHRIGTAEVEDALARHKYVSESAVVGFPHEVKGEGIFAFVILKNKADLGTYENELIKDLRDLCKSRIAAFAVPDYILFCDALPKTRSGKIMRRILRIIAAGGASVADLGDVSTLAEPAVVESLVKARQSLQSSNT